MNLSAKPRSRISNNALRRQKAYRIRNRGYGAVIASPVQSTAVIPSRQLSGSARLDVGTSVLASRQPNLSNDDKLFTSLGNSLSASAFWLPMRDNAAAVAIPRSAKLTSNSALFNESADLALLDWLDRQPAGKNALMAELATARNDTSTATEHSAIDLFETLDDCLLCADS